MPAATIRCVPARDAGRIQAVGVSGADLRARFPPGTTRAAIDGVAVPLPKARPQRIVVIGDTGCRIDRGQHLPGCDDPAQWPFASVARAAAATAPDLVIHVGDYHYRENACPAGQHRVPGSPGATATTPGTRTLPPARPLLRCRAVDRRARQSRIVRACGTGLVAFPRSAAARSRGRIATIATDDATGDFSAPYAVPIDAARRAIRRVRFVAGPMAALTPTSRCSAITARRFAEAFALAAQHAAARSSSAIIRSWASPPIRRKPQTPLSRQRGVAIGARTLRRRCLSRPPCRRCFAGHNHMFEVVSFSTASRRS